MDVTNFYRSCVIENLAPRNKPSINGVAYHYFDYKADPPHATRDVIANILVQLVHQLVSRNQELPAELNSAYDKSLESGIPAQLGIPELVPLVVTSAKMFNTRVFILVDAFDECTEREREELLKCLNTFLTSGIRVCITTRPQYEVRLRQKLGEPGGVIPIKADPNDVETYVRGGLRAYPDLHKDVKEEIVEKIKNTGAPEYLNPSLEADP